MKQEKLLPELRKAKADLAPPPAVPAEDIAVPTVLQEQKKAEPSSREPLMSGRQAAAAITATGNLFQWIVGAAGFAAVVWMFQNKRASATPAGPMASVPLNPQPTAKWPTPVKQLKVSEDPVLYAVNRHVFSKHRWKDAGEYSLSFS